MGLRLKFNVWMGTVLSIAIVISGVVIYSDLYQSARANAVKTASLLMAAAESTRDYTTTFIKPQLDRRLDI
jgi:cytochrome b subunit of formate dehydrogenase